MSGADALPSVERLRWQCRRGMLELDLVLEAYLDRRYAALDDDGKRRFIRFLDVDDPTLNAWLFGSEVPAEAGFSALVVAIREAAGQGG